MRATASCRSLSSSGSVWVQPTVSVEPRVIKCSAIENLCAHVYPTFTFFFRLQDGEDPLVHYEHMRQGLARILYQHDIMTGTIERDERGAFSVAIPATPHAGVRFYYSDLSQDNTFPDFEAFARAGFPFADGNLDGLSKLRPNPFPTSEPGDPLFIPQLTHIEGGLVLVCPMSHLVVDVVRSRDILIKWAASTLAVSETSADGRAGLAILEQFPEAVTDKSPLLPLSPVPVDFLAIENRSREFRAWKIIDPSDLEGTVGELRNFQPKCQIGLCAKSKEDYLRETVSGVWHFRTKDLKAISAAAQQASPEIKVSIMDVLVGFLWSRVFVAKYPGDSESYSQGRGYYGEIPKSSAIVCALDIRGKLRPPLPPNYMGVAVDLVRPEVPSSSLMPKFPGMVETSKYLADVAVAIRQSLSAWNVDHFMMLMEFINQTPKSPGFIPRGPIDLLVTDHRRFASAVASEWSVGLGRCVAFREPYVGRTCPTGEITIMPSQNEGDVEVMIAMERIVLERLSKDVELGRFGLRQFLMHNVVQSYGKSTRRSARL